jgi:hypothetical protein
MADRLGDKNIEERTVRDYVNAMNDPELSKKCKLNVARKIVVDGGEPRREFRKDGTFQITETGSEGELVITKMSQGGTRVDINKKFPDGKIVERIIEAGKDSQQTTWIKEVNAEGKPTGKLIRE